ncbi:MAG: UDP-N-acetyl-D-mannosamine dehydrogenase [Methylophagaceae bacterium]
MNPKVVTIGLGYIGLPTSALIASKGIHVHGVDVKQEIVDTINKGKIHIVEPELDHVVKKAVEQGYLQASTTPIEGDVYLIVVPTPFKGNHEPDTSYIEAATNSVLPLLKEGDLYIIESTSPIGTTEAMADFIYQERPDLVSKIHIAYCPERVLPGNVMFELVNNDRVIGGINNSSTDAAVEFYSKIVDGQLHKTTARTAEMCKLVENSSRDVQIAFANELSLICDKAEIDVWELIKLANKHPRVNILQPGCGVGGHCIAVDPYFITFKFPNESKIIRSAREINNNKKIWCVEKINRTINEYENSFGNKPSIAILGLAFKPDIDDLRESPALHIAENIFTTYPKDKVYFVEPNIHSHELLPITSLDAAFKSADLYFILVAHKEFQGLRAPNVLTFVNI